MPVDFSNQMWRLPTPKRFLDDIGDDVRGGVNVVVVYPPTTRLTTFLNTLYDHLGKERFQNPCIVDLTSQIYDDPFVSLCGCFPELEKDQYIEKAVQNGSLPEVIIVNPGSDLSPKVIKDWIDFLKRWAAASSIYGSQQSIVFPVCSRDLDANKLPSADIIRFKYKTIAGFPSALEIKMLCRTLTNETGAEDLWREYLLSSLAGNDIELCELLWDKVGEPISVIKLALQKHSINNWMTLEKLEKLIQGWTPKCRGQNFLPSPDDNYFPLTSSGITLFTPENGEEIHPSILVMMENDEDLRHRIWRAQASLLLPMIDEFRRNICHRMSDLYGDDWAKIEDELLESPVEMGELKKIFDCLPEKFMEQRKWGRVVRLAWRIRNDLAHYDTITYTMYQDFWELSNKLDYQMGG